MRWTNYWTEHRVSVFSRDEACQEHGRKSSLHCGTECLNDLAEQLNGGFPYCLFIAFYLVWPFVDRSEKD